MEHPCQQCGTTVEDGRPFCPQCRAPQIHVQVAAPDTGVTESLNPEAPVEARLASSQARPAMFGSTMERRVAVRAALKAGVLGVFIAIIPLLGIVLTGASAVYFYRRKNGFVLPAVLGARLGGAAGIVVFAINALFTIPIIVFHAQQECLDGIVKMAQRYGINTATPQFQASMQNLFTPSGLASFFIVAVVLASAGGALASLLLRPRDPPM
ncbi:MAG: zinc ribbon domain-containing protein [Terriglobales bacterium]